MSRTTIIGIDGATFSILDQYIESGLLPNLGALVQRGTSSPLRTIVPALTPPAWTSLMTGKRPGRHGVFDFFQKESADSEFFRLSTSQDVKTGTIWSLASDQGRKVVSLNFPLMYPAPKIDGAVVPGGWMPWRQLRLGCHPRGLFDELKELPSFDPKELSLDMELEAKSIDGCPDDEFADWINLHIRREERWMEILRHLVGKDDVDLLAVMFDGVDKLSHLCWKYIDPAYRSEDPTDFEREMVELCEGYFRRLDEAVGEIVELSGPDATIIVASDHGFGDCWDMFYANAWLHQEGYLHWAEDGEAGQGSGNGNGPSATEQDDGNLKVGFSAMTRHITELDWTRTVAYAATPSSSGIHIVANEPGTDQPMDPERRQSLTDEIGAKLAKVVNPLTGRPLLDQVVTRAEAFPGPYGDIGPDLNLVLADGASLSILRTDEVVQRRTEVMGNHRYDGVFIAAGPGIEAGARVDGVRIIDVAPLALYGLDVAIPDDLDGNVPEVVFRPDHLQTRPPRYMTVANDDEMVLSEEAVELDADEEATVMDRLRALGYVE